MTKYVQHGTVEYTRPAILGTGTILTVDAETTDLNGDPAKVELQVFWPGLIALAEQGNLTGLGDVPAPGDRVTINLEWEPNKAKRGHTWTHPMCLPCWNAQHPDREPVTLTNPDNEICCWCSMVTEDGIYTRHDPKELH